MTTLVEQLRIFHAAVTGAAPLDSASSLIEDDGVAPIARLGVYAHAYLARIGSVLTFDYPKLATALALRELAAAYLRAHPPADPSLREVGARLARFLADRGEPAHLVDLAVLERARTEAFDGGVDVPPLRRDQLAGLAAEAFPSLRLRLVPSSQLVTMTSNAHELWDALEHGQPAPAAAPAVRTILVWRRDVTVVHRRLEPDEAGVIRSLTGEGTSFAAACDLLAAHPAPGERALALLLRWLDAQILDGSSLAP